MLLFIENLGVIYGLLGYFIGSTLLGLIMVLVDKQRRESLKTVFMAGVRGVEVLIFGYTLDKEDKNNVRKSKENTKKDGG